MREKFEIQPEVSPKELRGGATKPVLSRLCQTGARGFLKAIPNNKDIITVVIATNWMVETMQQVSNTLSQRVVLSWPIILVNFLFV